MHKMTFLAGSFSIFLLLATLVGLFVVVVPVAAIPDITEYSTIQAAINAANPGDIIEVASNTYYEQVVVNKSLTLVGAGSSTTIIDGGGTGTVVRVTADNVNVTGFTIQNGGAQFADCGLFIGNCTGSTISNNTIRENGNNGLELRKTKGGNIVANTITGNSYAGIHVSDGDNNIFHGNTISYNFIGAWISSAITPSTFYHNNFINNTNQVLDYGYPKSKWDNEDIERGNFWSDYNGTDLDDDGVGDTLIPHLGIDKYPLMKPYQDVAPPIADAGPNQEVFQGMTVTFNGSGSYDDVGIKSYVWNFTDDTEPKTLTGVCPTYRFKNVGNFAVTLKVTDFDGKSVTDTMWVNVLPDNTKPSISDVSQEPEIPDHGETVTITVVVTDGESGVRNVTISYRMNSGSWINVPMSRLTGDTWEGEILGLPARTNVTYKIIAYDNAENFEVDDNAGQYYVYMVIPEFPAAIVLPLFIIVTLVAVALGKRKRTSES